MKQCDNFQKCNAPLCPLDLKGVWYSTEDICTSYKHNKNCDWIKRQRKITKTKVDGYFTIKMLNRNCIIGKGIKGIDPDKDELLQEQQWMKKHPIKKEMSLEQKAVLREKFEQIRKL